MQARAAMIYAKGGSNVFWKRKYIDFIDIEKWFTGSDRNSFVLSSVFGDWPKVFYWYYG